MFARALAVAGFAFIAAPSVADAASTASVRGSVTFEFTGAPFGVFSSVFPPLLSVSPIEKSGNASGTVTKLPDDEPGPVGFEFDITANGAIPSETSGVTVDLTDIVPGNSLRFIADVELDDDGFPVFDGPFDIGFKLFYDFTIENKVVGSGGIPSAEVGIFALNLTGDEIVTLDLGSPEFPMLPFALTGVGFQQISGMIEGKISTDTFVFGSIDFAARAAVSPVPLPAAAWLLLASLGALAGGGLATRRRAA